MPLLERDDQLQAAAGYLADAADGHGRLVFVAGEAGRRQDHVRRARSLADAGAAGQGRASGGCDGSATPAPLGPAGRDAAGAARRRVAAGRRPARGLHPAHRGAARSRRRAAPYLLVIEDAHWADEATLDLIRHLARRVHGCRALVLVTYRPEDATAGHPLRLVLGDAATRPASGGSTWRRCRWPPSGPWPAHARTHPDAGTELHG